MYILLYAFRAPKRYIWSPHVSITFMAYKFEIYHQIWQITRTDRKGQDYVNVNGEYQSTLQNITHYLRREKEVNTNNVLSYCDIYVNIYVQI